MRFLSHNRTLILRVILMTAGAVIGALSLTLFLAPNEIAPVGVSGIAVILNVYFDTPIGPMVFLFNLPILYLGYRMLGGWKVVAGTVYVVVVYSIALEVLTPLLPEGGLSDDVLLNALFGGIIGGVGGGIIYRAGGTFGGTSMIARIIQDQMGTPLSNTNIYANLFSVALAGIFLGWEGALYTTVVLVMDGAAADYILEGPSSIRTAMIITDKAQPVADAILHNMRRGVTKWEAEGMYTGESHQILFVTISRVQVNSLRQEVLNADPEAFIVIGHGQVAYGEGFKRPIPPRMG
jgi:uncharacterized membrane-anchored protein YitT (DUF2179 family)